MSDHFDTEDSRTDLCDLYVFAAPERSGTSILILDVNPEATASEISTDPAASYELKIDTDGDLEPDLAFHVIFASSDGSTSATVYRAAGAAARGTGAVGDAVIIGAPVASDGSSAVVTADGYRFFAGLRSDPHFKDVKGFRNDFQFTGDDPIARRNVFGIVLEVPDADFGGGPIRLWSRAMTVVDGEVRQVDQAGRPGINNTFNEPEEDRLAFGASSPAEQRDLFGDRFEGFLRSIDYPPDEARELMLQLLPDVLEYDPSMPAGYPNGRRLTDDTADLTLALLTRGRFTSDLVGPHDDLLDHFPYLGEPHPPETALVDTE